MKVKVNSTRMRRILAMRQDGYTYNEIAEKFGVSRQRVHQIVQWQVQKPPKKLKKAEKYMYPNLYVRIVSEYRSISKFAEQSGFDRDKLYLYLRGERQPRLDTAIGIADYLGQDVRDLFTKNPNCK